MVIEFGKVGKAREDNFNYFSYDESKREYVYGQKSKMYTNINELIVDVKSLDDLKGEKNDFEFTIHERLKYGELLYCLTNMANGYFDPNKENSEIKPMPNEVITAVSDIISKKMPENLSELLQVYHNSVYEKIPPYTLEKFERCKENDKKNNFDTSCAKEYVYYNLTSYHEIVDTYGRLLLASNPNKFNQIVNSISTPLDTYEKNPPKGKPVALTEKQMEKLIISCQEYLKKPLEREELKRDKNFPEFTSFVWNVIVADDQLKGILRKIEVNIDEVLGYLYPETEDLSNDEKIKKDYDKAYIEKNSRILECCADDKEEEITKNIDYKTWDPVYLEYDPEKKEYVVDIKDKAIQRVRNNKVYTYRELYEDGLNGKKTKIDLNTFFDEHLDEIDSYLAQDYILEHANNPNAELYSFDKINKFVKETIKREKQQNKNDKNIIHKIISKLRINDFNKDVKDINEKINEGKNQQQTNEQQGPSIDE